MGPKHIVWKKSSHSPSSDCVMIGSSDGALKHIGDSKDPDGPVLTFKPEALTRFIQSIKGEVAGRG